MHMRAKLFASLAAVALMVPAAPAVAQAPAKLLMTQVEVRGGPTNSSFDEYVVIKNPGASTVDLSRYYLTDATFTNGNQFYYNLPDAGLPIGGGGFNDFVARFPDGATLAPGQEITVSINGSTSFSATYGIDPHYELYEDGASPDGVPDMIPARPGSIVDNLAQLPSLTNSGEVAVLFYWDGTSDLVVDVDYVVWGDKEEGVDKSTISIDGPDADATATAYKADTAIAAQSALPTNPNGTFIRTDESEGTQKTSGGNGVGGRDETSENLTATFSSSTTGVPPGTGSQDTTPPTLVVASGTNGSTVVAVTFSEAIGSGALTAGNYAVFPTASPGTPIAVLGANQAANPAAVALELASPLVGGTSYTVRVSNVQDVAGNVIAANSQVSFTASGGGGGAFTVTGAFPFGPRHIGVAFSDKVNAGQATTAANFAVTFAGTPVTPTSVALQDNGQTAILVFGSDLPKNSAVSVTVSGVTSSGGAPLTSGGPFQFTTGTETVLGISDIQANPSGFQDQIVTVIGQIFMPVTVQGSQISGYLQDGTGRGLNLFDFTTSVPAAVNGLGKVVKVTGTVDVFFTTTELTAFTSTLLAENQPHLGPRVLTVAEANSPAWEGTYIQTSATLTSAPAPSGSSNHNAPAEGGGASITFRIRNNTGINFSQFIAGDLVTGAGAGAAFQSTFQVNVGLAEDFTKGGGGPDTTPPTLVGASGAGGSRSIAVAFSEAVGTGASTASNYTVTATGGGAVSVVSASPSGSTVTLTTAADLTGGTSYTVRVSNVQDLAGNVIAANSQVSFTTSGGGGGGFTVTGLFQFGPAHIGITFGEEVNPDQAATVGIYTVSPQGSAPAVSLQSAQVQANGRMVILRTAANLPQNAGYSVAISGLTSRGGDPLQAGGPTTFTTASQTVLGIADIQADPTAFQDQTVTVIGQVFMPVTVQGSQISGYLQDGTGRGLNLFNFTTTVPAAVNANTKVVRVTGTIDVFFTTVELTGFSSTLLADNQPPLGPRSLTVAQANSSEWEGTYIQTTATLASAFAASGASNHNATAEDGGATITIRIRNNAGVNFAQFKAGDRVTAAGAGAAFQSTFQINVGIASDFGLAGTGPPTLVGAFGDGGSRQIRLTFSEDLDRASAETEANYRVFPTADPSAELAVENAALSTQSASVVVLSLDGELEIGTAYTVEVTGVRDAQGETIAAGSRTAFTARESRLVKVRLVVPPVTLVKGLDGAGERLPIKVEGEPGSRIVCRLVDLQGTVVRILADEFLPTTAPAGGQPSIELTWDGRDESYEFVPAGMYICHVLATDLNGKVTDDRAPVVVSVRLD